jgi:hypothetical protein
MGFGNVLGATPTAESVSYLQLRNVYFLDGAVFEAAVSELEPISLCVLLRLIGNFFTNFLISFLKSYTLTRMF